MRGFLLFGVTAVALAWFLLLFRQWITYPKRVHKQSYPVFLIRPDEGDWELETTERSRDKNRTSVIRIKLPRTIMTFRNQSKSKKKPFPQISTSKATKYLKLLFFIAVLLAVPQTKAQTNNPAASSSGQAPVVIQKQNDQSEPSKKDISPVPISDNDKTSDSESKTEQSSTSSAQTHASSTQQSSPTPARRGLPAPLDGIFPSSEYIGPTIGVPDTDPVYPLTKAVWDICPALKDAKIKVYGWVNPGYNASTSRNSNIPLSYAIVPNSVELDQAVLRVERVPDTVQTDHVDWGFRVSDIYGIDYRWTTAQGYFSGQLFHHNLLNGWDPVELYGLLYFPHVAKGMVLKFGRYISPPDIEAQLAPDNYLYTHSIFFNYDAYTNTGIIASVMLNDQWTVQIGFHSGKDVAPWAAGAHPSFQAMARWVSKSNNDSLYGGIASLNNGRFKGNLDNLNQVNLTWTHRFNEKGTIFTSTESYFLQTSGAPLGGSVIDGPPRPWFTNVGIGAPIQGNAIGTGVVNYTVFKISDKDFLTLRPIDIMVDKKGERSGFPTTYQSATIGVTHRFSTLFTLRPEIRFEHAYSGKPYDNGTRRNQFTFGMDLIARF